MFVHVIERFLIHFTAAPALLLIASIALRFWARKKPNSMFPPRTMEQTLLYGAVIAFALTALREAFDVANGQPLFKAPIDYVSWLLGLGVAVWGLYRWRYFSWEQTNKSVK